jgi:hypothetical protein
MVNLLYKEFLNDKRIYALNVGYWTKLFKRILQTKEVYKRWLNVQFNNNLGFYDGNPIYDILVENKRKAVRIIQEEPETPTLSISAWIDETETELKEKINELVIVLELSKEARIIAEKWIKAWLIDNKTKEEIIDLIENTLNTKANKEKLSPSSILV